jgi:hypothetical protein
MISWRRGFLRSRKLELLHEERYIGNTALHQLAPPSKADLEDGLFIVEVAQHDLFFAHVRIGYEPAFDSVRYLFGQERRDA